MRQRRAVQHAPAGAAVHQAPGAGLIEQRRILALDANQNAQVYAALDALMIAPELFTPEASYYLGLYSVARQLEAARTDDAKREGRRQPVGITVTIEDGNISDVDKALRAAQEALKQALDRRCHRRRDQETDGKSACGAGQFPPSARRTASQQSAAIGAPLSQHRMLSQRT